MKRLPIVVVAALLCASGIHAQTATPTESAPPMPANVRFDVVITDDNGAGKVLTKTVTLNLIVSANAVESGIGQIRSSARPGGSPMIQSPDGKSVVPLDLNLWVDITRPRLMPGSKVRVPIAVEYRPYSAEPKSPTATVRASVDMLMDHGRKIVISRSADPVTDRKVVIEVTPTIER